MTEPIDATGAWAWVFRCIGVGAALYAIGAKVFSFVTRPEHAKQLALQDAKFIASQAAMKADIDKTLEQHRLERIRISGEQMRETRRLHGENGKVNTEIFERLLAVEKGQSRIEGALSGRFPALDPNAR